MAAGFQRLGQRLRAWLRPRASASPRAAHAALPPDLRQLPGVDWGWQVPLSVPPGFAEVPASGAEVRPGLRLFHDAPLAGPVVSSGAEGVLLLRFDGFSGSFASLVFDLPPAALQGLRAQHLFRLGTDLDFAGEGRLYARLNIRHGPNLAQISREIRPGSPEPMAEFDLFYAGLQERRIRSGWIDLIVNPGPGCGIRLRGLTLSRRPRAAL